MTAAAARWDKVDVTNEPRHLADQAAKNIAANSGGHPRSSGFWPAIEQRRRAFSDAFLQPPGMVFRY